MIRSHDPENRPEPRNLKDVEGLSLISESLQRTAVGLCVFLVLQAPIARFRMPDCNRSSIPGP
jgi:hypothetical protein